MYTIEPSKPVGGGLSTDSGRRGMMSHYQQGRIVTVLSYFLRSTRMGYGGPTLTRIPTRIAHFVHPIGHASFKKESPFYNLEIVVQ